MATIGLDKLYYAKITEDEVGNETYEVPNTPIDFDDILETTYKVVLKPDYFVEDGLGGYKDISSDANEVKKLVLAAPAYRYFNFKKRLY